MLKEAWERFCSNAGALYRGLGIVLLWGLGLTAVLVGLYMIHPALGGLAAIPVALIFGPKAQAALTVQAVDAVRDSAGVAMFWEKGGQYFARFLGLLLLQGAVTGLLSAAFQFQTRWGASLFAALLGACVTIACLDSIVVKPGFWRAVGTGLLIWRKPLATLGLIAVVSGPGLAVTLLGTAFVGANSAASGTLSALTVAVTVVVSLFDMAYQPFANVFSAVWYCRHVTAKSEPVD